MKTYFFLFFSLAFMFSCAQKMTVSLSSKAENIAYKPDSSHKKKFMTCNFFSDETFRGYIYRSSLQKDCFHIDIVKSPQELLKNEDLFLQIYPFKISNDEFEYGFAQSISTVSKFEKNKPLMKSQIIDTHIVQVELDLEADHFFLDHNLEICHVDEQWQGLQLVIYERRQEQEEPVAIRITKFLTPPFLIHPEYFRDKMGINLAAFHPFLDSIPQFKSEPDSYYKMAEQLCSHL